MPYTVVVGCKLWYSELNSVRFESPLLKLAFDNNCVIIYTKVISKTHTNISKEYLNSILPSLSEYKRDKLLLQNLLGNFFDNFGYFTLSGGIYEITIPPLLKDENTIPIDNSNWRANTPAGSFFTKFNNLHSVVIPFSGEAVSSKDESNLHDDELDDKTENEDLDLLNEEDYIEEDPLEEEYKEEIPLEEKFDFKEEVSNDNSLENHVNIPLINSGGVVEEPQEPQEVKIIKIKSCDCKKSILEKLNELSKQRNKN